MNRGFHTAAGKTGPDIYQRITDKIVDDLLHGVTPWAKPWSAGTTGGRIHRPLRHNGEPYSGINVLMLWSAAIENGYSSPRWMTFRQASELGGHVRKGEHGSLVVYAKTYTKTGRDEGGVEVETDIPFLKGYTVFNVEQIENLPEQYYERPPPRFSNEVERIEHAERFIAATGADIRHGGAQAYYTRVDDYIRVPPAETFRDRQGLYSTIFHELGHWTQHPSRLNIDFGRKVFADPGYAMGELFAELTSSYLCADLEIEQEVAPEHARYIAGWIRGLQDDKHAIFVAASHAQRAADYLHSLQPDLRPPQNEAGPSTPAP